MAKWKPTTALAHKRRCNRLARELGMMKPDSRNRRGEATYRVPVDRFPPYPLPKP